MAEQQLLESNDLPPMVLEPALTPEAVEYAAESETASE